MKKIAVFLLCTLGISAMYAQDEGNPFAQYGYKPRVVTTIMGRSVVHDRQPVVAIGSVLFDTKTKAIVGDFEPDSTVQWLDPKTVSMFVADVGRFITPDPLAEKYYHISPYAYCGNNPIRYIDPTGMWFDDANLRRANRIERRIERQMERAKKEIARLTEKGQNTDDAFARLSELHQSKADVGWMKSDTKTEYRYEKASSKDNKAGGPSIDGLGTNTVTMYVEKGGNEVHESRHGGDVARGTLTKQNYESGHEVSAYKAQYAFDGTLNYIDASNPLNQQIAQTGMIPPASTITDIKLITPNFVKTKIGEVKSVTVHGNVNYGLIRLYGWMR